MTPVERDLRQALETRSGEATPEFRARLSGALQGGRPAMNAMPALALAMVLVLSVGAVGILMMARSASRVSYGGPASGNQYTVVTSLMSARGGPVNACWAMPLPLPPIGCGGVEVTNVVIADIPGAVTYRNGTVGTPELRLVGTWDGRVLRLTEKPQPTTLPETRPQPVAQAPPASSGKTAQQVMEEFKRDEAALRQRGIVLLGFGAGSDGVEVTLAAADPASVQYLYSTYGRMKISGWLQPVNPVNASPLTSPVPSAIPIPTVAQLSVPSGNVVWALVDDFMIFRSTDQGKTWEAGHDLYFEDTISPSTSPLHSDLHGSPEVSFVGAHEGWLLAKLGKACNSVQTWLWHTADAGGHWEQVPATGILTPQCKEGLSFVDAAHGFISAWDEGHRPTVYRSSDGGLSWSPSTLPDPPGIGSAGGISLRAGLVKAFGSTLLVSARDGQGGVYFFGSTDGGATWAYRAKTGLIPSFNSYGTGSLNVTFVTASRWLKIGNDSSAFETTDAGKTWHSYPTDYQSAGGVPTTFAFGDEKVGYGTVRGGINRTVDGGSHWVWIKTPGTQQQPG